MTILCFKVLCLSLGYALLQANKLVLVYNQFRLATVIEAAMEIAGMQAAQKRLQVCLVLAPDSDRGDVRCGVVFARCLR